MEDNYISPDELAGMALFAAVVEAGSLTAAAERLALSKSAVSKALVAQEARLAAKLLQRTTRRQSLTEVGMAYYEHCRRVLLEAGEARRAVDRLHAQPVGVLRITAPISFGSEHLSRHMPELLKRHPGMQVDLQLSDRLVDLAEEGYDLAIRVTDKPDPLLVARALAPIRWVVCASPAYLAQHGTPMQPSGLAGHACLTYPALTPGGAWPFLLQGQPWQQPVSGPLRMNNSLALLLAALGGLGIVRLPSFAASGQLADGSLRPLLQDYAVPPQTALAVYLPNRYLSPKVRACVDFLRERLGNGGRPYWDHWLDGAGK
ncbi:LysR family transcriptional regulator [Chitinimonas viridis]|uniref:LysR family transcriptional regulator n=1 Tax=Chitinimonas viridis TaxID=664880 RepID=A0ABT8B2U3_9NEIS|nr:LysR family transcriptional regulator [Chitinimonas viridis]MDN3576577.1 LysR family transcriptional regulator [Chitinimonas viridis]